MPMGETRSVDTDWNETFAGLSLTNIRQLMMLRTNIPDHIRRPLSEEVVSVIHAPPSFQNWVRFHNHVPQHGYNADTSTPQKSSDTASKSTLSNSMSGTSVEGSSAGSPPPSEPSTVVSCHLPTHHRQVRYC